MILLIETGKYIMSPKVEVHKIMDMNMWKNH